MTLHELEWLADQASKASFIVELGCWKGRSTAALIDNSSGIVWTIDNWSGATDPTDATSQEVRDRGSEMILSEVLNTFAGDLKVNKLHIVEMDSVVGANYLLHTVGPMFDFIFIDGDHSYERVLSEIKVCLKLLVPGGLISGHDYGWLGVRNAVSETIQFAQNPVDSIWCGKT